MAWKDNYDEMQVKASEIQEGDFLSGLGNGYVIEVETGNGYLDYPRTGYGSSGAMPEDTIIVSFNNDQGEEGYLLLPPDTRVTVLREK